MTYCSAYLNASIVVIVKVHPKTGNISFMRKERKGVKLSYEKGFFLDQKMRIYNIRHDKAIKVFIPL